MHLTAESHVGCSIEQLALYIQTNIVGTYTLLEAARNDWNKFDIDKKAAFRFHHISTDEVYGDLAGANSPFAEETAYKASFPFLPRKPPVST